MHFQKHQLESFHKKTILLTALITNQKRFIEDYGMVYKMPVAITKNRLRRLNKMLAALEFIQTLQIAEVR